MEKATQTRARTVRFAPQRGPESAFNESREWLNEFELY